MDFETLNTRKIYQGRVFEVRQDTVLWPDGRQVHLDIVNHPPAVVILPVDETGHIWFIRQYRHATGGLLLELPAGVIEAGESPEACAGREIREEIGMSAQQIEKIGEFYMAPGYSTEYLYIFIARQLQSDPLPGDVDEFIHVDRIPIKDAYDLADQGALPDAKSLAVLLLARRHLDP